MTPQSPTARLKALQTRARTLNALRRFFEAQDYLEVQTPLRLPALAPERFIEPVASDGWLLQTSPELCMKRLLAAGHRRIFQICRCFRKNERGRRHLPEMTMLEWYTAGQDYRHMMHQCEQLIAFVARQLGKGVRMEYQGQSIDLTPPWPRLTVAAAFERYAPLSMTAALAEDCFDEMVALAIEPRLDCSRPVILCDYPLAQGALAAAHPQQPSLVQRFEVYIGGLELCNAFTELVDVREQRRRFDEEREMRRKDGAPAYPLPEPFLAALEGMPPATGNALGVDRLVMLMADADAIDAVVAFTPESL